MFYKRFVFVSMARISNGIWKGHLSWTLIHHVAVHFTTCVMVVEWYGLYTVYIVTFTVTPVKLCSIWQGSILRQHHSVSNAFYMVWLHPFVHTNTHTGKHKLSAGADDIILGRDSASPWDERVEAPSPPTYTHTYCTSPPQSNVFEGLGGKQHAWI